MTQPVDNATYRDPGHVLRILALFCLVGLALLTFVVAYPGLVYVGLVAVHLPIWAAFALPAVVDLGLATAALGAANRRRQGRRAGLEYSLLILLASTSVVGQVAHVLAVAGAAQLAWVGVLIASVLPLALLLSVEAVIRNTGADEVQKRARAQRVAAKSPRAPAATQTASAGPPSVSGERSSRPAPIATRTGRDERFTNNAYLTALDEAIADLRSQNSVAFEFSHSRATVQNDVRARKAERELVVN